MVGTIKDSGMVMYKKIVQINDLIVCQGFEASEIASGKVRLVYKIKEEVMDNEKS
jgi:hypothetical protein